MHELFITILNMRLLDGLDILLVGLLFYVIFALLRETRSFVALLGFIICILGSLLVFLVARTFEMRAMILIFQYFWIIVVLVFLIVFQNEFRKALTSIGQMKLFRSLFPRRENDVLDEVVDAVMTMSQSRTGALIVLERRNPLSPYTRPGSNLDALVSTEALRTIFTPLTPLHDGAALIQGDRVTWAGCILPLTSDTELSKDLGTRHRAALGVSEETDAVVIVVSEETGIVSVVVDGKIDRGFKADTLRRRLERELSLSSDDENASKESAA